MSKNNHKHKSAATARDNQRGQASAAAPSANGGAATQTGGRNDLWTSIVISVLLAAAGILYLITRNSDVLYMAQERSFFTTNHTFLHDCMQLPGGLIAWVASYLSQFFYYPAWGASIMIALWMASLWAGKRAFGTSGAWMAVLAVPVVCLLVSVIDTGYWIYYLKQQGYWFYGTVGYLSATLMTLVWSLLRKRADKVIGAVFIALAYPFLGWYSIMALLWTVALGVAIGLKERQECAKVKAKSAEPAIGEQYNTNGELVGAQSCVFRAMMPASSLILAGVTPLVFHWLYPTMRLEDAWTAGVPPFANDTLVSHWLRLPFFILAILPMSFPFLPKTASRKLAYTVSALVVVACGFYLEQSDVKNYNYHAEMRITRAAEEQDWDKVLAEMSSLPGDASRQMVLFKNIALMHKGELGNKLFKYNNMGAMPTNQSDSLDVHLVQTAGPLIYYYHGKTNFASRWCIENSVEFGYSFETLKILSLCALVNGESDVARKYLDILQTSTFHKEWAERYMPLTDHPETIDTYPEFEAVRELYNHMGSVIDGDNGLCEVYLLGYFSNTINNDSRILQEMTLCYALIQKDIALFWPRFFQYARMHRGEPMPTHYQEAAMLYSTLEQPPVNPSTLPFDESVTQSYQNFHQLSQSLLRTGMDHAAVGEAMKSSFGDTFFWFYFFSRNVNTY